MNSTTTKDSVATLIGLVIALALLVYGIVQIYAGWIGIDHRIGALWATASVVVALLFRFTLPITVGSFFCAMEVWGWPWWGAALFAAPGLAFMLLMIPGLLASSFATLRST